MEGKGGRHDFLLKPLPAEGVDSELTLTPWTATPRNVVLQPVLHSRAAHRPLLRVSLYDLTMTASTAISW